MSKQRKGVGRLKKEFRVLIVATPLLGFQIFRVTAMKYGKDNVIYSFRPQDTYGLIRKLDPTTLFLEPRLFQSCSIPPQDILSYRRKRRIHTFTLYGSEEEKETCKEYRILNAKKEYVYPINPFDTLRDIPLLSKNEFVFRKKPLEEFTRKNLDEIFTECGLTKPVMGRQYLLDALYILYFNPDLQYRGKSQIFRTLGERYGVKPRNVESAMERFLDQSWTVETEQKLRNKLKIADHHTFTPIYFGRFTEIFNTYYTLKYGRPQDIIRPKIR